MIQLTPDAIPGTLAIVRLRVAVEGLVFEKVFEADPGLKYKFAWDRRNAYNQKVYGIVTASGKSAQFHMTWIIPFPATNWAWLLSSTQKFTII